jgi:hypothetical protein
MRTAATGNTPTTSSGTSQQAAAPLQQAATPLPQAAAPLSTFKTAYKGDAAFKELLQQKGMEQQLNPPQIRTAITLQHTRTEAAPSRKLHATTIECM